MDTMQNIAKVYYVTLHAIGVIGVILQSDRQWKVKHKKS